VDTEIVRLTPAIAAEFLAATGSNRGVNKSHVQFLANEITSGRWVLNGAAIRFDSKGKMRDGQHRCHAVVISQRPVDTLVVRGLPETAFETMDIGVKRTLAHWVGIWGYKNAAALATCASMVIKYRDGFLVGNRPGYRVTPKDVRLLLSNEPRAVDSTTWAVSAYGRSSVPAVVGSGLASFLHFMFCSEDAKRGEEFLESFMTGANLGRSSPQYQLRNRILSERHSSTTDLTKVGKLALIFKAWIAYRDGREIGKLLWKAGEQFPWLDGEPMGDRVKRHARKKKVS